MKVRFFVLWLIVGVHCYGAVQDGAERSEAVSVIYTAI